MSKVFLVKLSLQLSRENQLTVNNKPEHMLSL